MSAGIFEEPAAQRQSLCIRCREPATLKCLRCEDPYCSMECQDLNWNSHRFICLPKPPLIPADATAGDENPTNFTYDEPQVLAEQLRSMINVCQEFLQKLEIKPNNDKCNKTPATIANTQFAKIKHNDKENEIPNEFPTDFILNSNEQNSTEFDENPLSILKVNNNQTERHRNKMKKQKDLSFSFSVEDENTDAFTESLNETSLTIFSQTDGNETVNNQVVYLTSFRSANRVGICPKEITESGDWTSTLDKIAVYGKTAPTLTRMPQPGAYVIALRKNVFSRGKVVEQKNYIADRLRLDFVDYGNLCYRQLHECRQISSALAALPVFTEIVQLNDVGLLNYDKKILSYLSQFEKKFYKMKEVANMNNMALVELYDHETGESMNKKIMQLKNEDTNINKNISKSLKPKFKQNKSDIDDFDEPSVQGKTHTAKLRFAPIESDDEYTDTDETTPSQNFKHNLTKETNKFSMPVLQPPFKHQIFAKNLQNFPAIILDTEMSQFGYFSCIMKKNLDHLQNVHLFLSNYVDSGESYIPVDNEYVIAKFTDNKWYRGKVTGTSSAKNEFEINYIDYMNTMNVKCKDIRRYPSGLTIDCYTTNCALYGMPNTFPPKLKIFLKANINKFEEIHIDRVVNIEDGDLAIILWQKIIDSLKEHKLI